MILKGSQRGGPKQLAAHLLNQKDNDHVMVHEVRGFMASDLQGAMLEAVAIAKGTRCRQPVFSLSLNPPKDADVPLSALIEAADRAEVTLGLKDQPRAIVIHEKQGRKHAHVVWSRISATEMKAVNLPFFKTKLNGLSKELYLENGWDLPEGHRTNAWKNPLNFTLAEWQQAKRADLDPREIKQIFHTAWKQSDGPMAFKAALESHGYFLAQGDRRGLVALDLSGDVYSVARYAGIKAKDLNSFSRKIPMLETVDETRKRIKAVGSERAREMLAQHKMNKQAQAQPLREQLRMLVKHHRKERSLLSDKQEMRRISEAKTRAERFRRGLGAIMDILTGRLFTIKTQNEREAYEGLLRDRKQTEVLLGQQAEECRSLHRQIEILERERRREQSELVRRFISITRRINSPSRERISNLRT